MILGTAAYMSPEQAKGKPVDRRSDVWAFGTVLFEMLSGHRPFAGETVTETLAAVLRAEVDWALLPPGLPPPLADLLHRCLERDPRRRLHDIADARIVIEDLLEGRWRGAPAPAPAPGLGARPLHRGGRRLAVRRDGRGAGARRSAGRLEPDLVRGRPFAPLREHPWRNDEPLADRPRPATGRPLGAPQPVTVPSSWAVALSASADGRRVAFLDRNVRTAIRLAPFDPVSGAIVGTPRSVPLGTLEVHDTVDLAADGETLLFDDAGLPQHLFLADAAGTLRQLTDGPHRDRQGTFSPDGKWIAFQTDRWPSKLALIRPDGSGLHELVTGRATSAFYPNWSPDGRALAAGGTQGPFRVEISDGKVVGPGESLAPLAEDGLAFWPTSWSPDGRRLAGAFFSSANAPRGAAVYSFADRSYRRIPTDDANQLLFLPDGQTLLLTSPHGLKLVDLESGKVRPLLAATEGWRIVRAALSRDGRQLAWHERADESDLWLATFAVAP